MPPRLPPLALAALLLAASARADDYETYAHDPQRTGLSASYLDPTSLTQTWTGTGYVKPIIVGNTVYASNNSQVASFNLANGQVNWSTTAAAGPIGYAGSLLVGSNYTVINSTVHPYLEILSAATGAPLYSVNVPEGPNGQITIATDTTTSQPVAYVGDGRGDFTAVRLGPSSGTVLWTATGLLAGSGLSSVLGDYVLFANYQEYYAINRTSGAVNRFYSGGGVGGENYTPVVDATRNEFYINSRNTLTAYTVSGTTISQLWQITGAGIGNGAVALDPNGFLYSTDTGHLVKLDPATGHTLAMVTGTFANNSVPIVTANGIWNFGPGRGNADQAVFIYSLADLSLITKYTELPNVSATTYNGISAVDETHFAFDEGPSSNNFIVSTGTILLPEPASLALLLFGSLPLLRPRPARR